MLNTLKLLMNRFRPKTKIDHKEMAQSCGKEAEPQNQLVHVPSQHNLVLMSTSNFEINEIRQRANDELRSSDVSARQRDRLLLDKWFNRGELSESGSFNLAEFQRRMEEPACSEQESIGALPAQEDMLMAFCKPEFDLFEEEKISLSGVFLRVDPHEDFDEQYSMPLLPMYGSSDAHANDIIMIDEDPSLREEFNLDFAVDETFIPALNTLDLAISFNDTAIEDTLQDLIQIPVPVPAFIPATSAVVEEQRVSKIDPSVLFEEWTSDQVFDPLSSEAASTFSSERISTDKISFDAAVSTEIVSSEVISEKTAIETSQSTAPVKSKPYVNLVAKPNDAYWSESDRLTRFGRRRTSASCSSTRLRALTQSA